ncbi:hypothetical protein L6164_034479 [Bauhinia variegata]|uniref:Uncharacterized protein n=1 Tax=Bauhinia variegata TaxID=167791 RepID=A0ACB9KVB4_BAUVA|nr:hypothetical protein L6164_034479 [Bauhinia variegata]
MVTLSSESETQAPRHGPLLGLSYGPKDLAIIARTAGRLAGPAIGYAQLARGQFETVLQQSQARQVHKELPQLDAIRHEIRSISMINPRPLTQTLVDNLILTIHITSMV